MRIELRNNEPVFIAGIRDDVLPVSEGVKRLRKDKRLSTTELARLLGVSRRTVEGWEQGKAISRMALLFMRRIIDEK